MRLHRNVAQRELAEHAANRLDHRRHHALNPLPLRCHQRRDAVQEERQAQEIEQPIDEAEPRERMGHREVEDPSEQHISADEQRQLLHRTERHRRFHRFGSCDAARGFERRDRHRILHQPPADDQRERDRDQEERREHAELPRLGQHAGRQVASLVRQQRQHRSGGETEQSTGQAAPDDAHEQRARHQIAGNAAKAHQPERAPLVKHQQAGEVPGEHPRHPQQRQRNEQRHEADQPRDPLHPFEQYFRRAVDDEAHAAAEFRIVFRRFTGFVAVAGHRLLQRAFWNRRVLLRAAVKPAIERLHVGERSGNVPAGHEAGAIDAGEVHDLGRVLRHLNVPRVLIGDADNVRRDEPGGDLIELRQDVPFVRHQQNRADVWDVADRSGLIHQPAIQLVAIEPDDFVHGRVEEEPRLILDVDLQREVTRALQREERLAHRVLGTDERQDGATPGWRLLVAVVGRAF